MAAAFRPPSLGMRVWSRVARPMLALACLSTLACGPQVHIILIRGDDLAGRPDFVRFEVADLTSGELERFGPYSSDGLPGNEFARIPPDHAFVMYAIGCKTEDEAGCLDEAELLAVGCTEEQTLGRGAEATIEIVLHSVAVGLAECDLPELTE
jgi:hypothetical protein